MERFVNLTPHAVTVLNADGDVVLSVPPSGTVARCEVKSEVVNTINGVPITKNVFGPVDGLPDREEGTYFIVSALVKNAHPDRDDLLVPVGTVRAQDGRILGCTSLGV